MIDLNFNNKLEPKRSRILLAEPFLDDQFFKRSAVLIAEHNEEGTTGFIFNKPLDVRLQELLPNLPDYNGNVYFGGPVCKDQLFFVHTLKEISDSLTISKGLYWGGDFNTTKELLEQGKLNDTNIRFFVGYSGWDPEQLKGEIEKKSWIVAQRSIKDLFSENYSSFWTNTLKSMGEQYAIMANFPENPELN